jgi:sec-independent protein translocase protein TatA
MPLNVAHGSLKENQMGIPAPTELLLILAIVIIIFGAKKIPEIMGGVAQGIKSFKKNLDDDDKTAPTLPTPEKTAEQTVVKAPQS